MVESRTHGKRIPRINRGDGRKKALEDKQPGKHDKKGNKFTPPRPERGGGSKNRGS